MSTHKYRISREDFRDLCKQASYEYYEFHILQNNKSKALTPLAKKVRNIKNSRKASINECTNEHILRANRIKDLRYKIKKFRREPGVYEADRLIDDYQDIISAMKYSSIRAFLNRITRIISSAGEQGYILDNAGWHWTALDYVDLTDEDSGKWMCFFVGDNYEWASKIVEMAVIQDVCTIAKCSLPTHLNNRGRGVICLYGDYMDYDFHRRCTQFMIEHNMIQKTKKGLYHDISFKMDWMTLLGIYGVSGTIHLHDIRDLKTGEWIYEDDEIKR